MARRPTNAEWAQLRGYFPRLALPWILGEATPRYNCLAWATGRTDRWVWPWPHINPTLPQMSAFLATYGYREGTPTWAGVYGASPFAIGHIGRYYPNVGPTSKLGQLWLITHTWDNLQGGVYGRFIQSYRAGGAVVEMAQGDEEIEKASVEPAETKLPELPADDLDRLRELVAAVPADARQDFEAAYEAWKQTWSALPAALDSSGTMITQNAEFVRLVNIPAAALPLLMEKLVDPDEHFALRVAEQLLPPEHVPMFGADHPEVLEGEQYRARLLLSNWLAAG